MKLAIRIFCDSLRNCVDGPYRLRSNAWSQKALTFNGKVEDVNADSKSLKVNGEKVEGWMEAMTMDYEVGDPAILRKLKPGDR